MYLPRDLEKKALKLWGRGKFILIRGPRRAGKTTLLKRLQELKGGTYITFEDPAMREAFLRNPVEFVKEMGFPLYLDEVQYLGEEGSGAFKLVYDKFEGEGQILLSGSGAFDIKTKILSYLVGRVYLLDLLPLSFGELTEWKGKQYSLLYRRGNKKLKEILEGKSSSIPSSSESLEKLFEEFSVWGSYPEIVLTKDRETLSSLITTTIEQDIIRYFSLKHGKKLWGVVKKLSTITGNLLDYSSLGVSYSTALEYLSILENSFIIKTIPTYSTNKLVELTKREKIYFYDNGFRNGLIGVFLSYKERPDGGQTLENSLFPQLLKYGEVHYWRTKSKAEVDFIIKREKEIIPIEVKVKGYVSPSLLSFIKKYNPEKVIVASSTVFEKKVNESEVLGIPFYYF